MTARRVTVVGKSFRLFDFKTYDRVFADAGDSDESGDAASPPSDDSGGGRGDSPKPVFAIQCFGINERGQSCSITVRDMQPFFFVKVGPHWSQSRADDLLRAVREAAGARGADDVLSAAVVDRQQLYGFTGGRPARFVKLTFASSAAMRKARGLWHKFDERSRAPRRRPATDEDGVEIGGGSDDVAEPRADKRIVKYKFKGELLEIYEGNIQPLLRYFHIHDVSPSGWVFLKTGAHGVEVPSVRQTTCDFEYVCGAADLVPQPTKETRVPYKICSYDIEASSSHGDFPLPRKSYLRLATQLADEFARGDADMSGTLGNIKFRRCVNTAFGYDTLPTVDRIYTKTMPSRDAVAKGIAAALAARAPAAPPGAAPAAGRAIDRMFRDMMSREAGDDEDAVAAAAHRGVLAVLQDAALDRMQKAEAVSRILARALPPVEGDSVTFIGSTFVRHGEPAPYRSHMLAIDNCDDIAGVDVELAADEADLLLRWRDLINTEKPDIIIGYNIFGFDYEFMFRRAQELGIAGEFMTLSKNIDESCLKQPFGGEADLDSTHICLATGEYDMRYPCIPGTIQIDLYFYLRRDFNLSSYKLDDVAGIYIGDTISRVEHGEDATHLYTANVTGLAAGDFVHIVLDGFTSDYYADGAKLRVVSVVPGAPAVVTVAGRHLADVRGKLRWAMAKDDITPKDIFRLTDGSPADRARVAKYCVQDCNLVHHLFNKLDVLTGYVEMAKICSVPMSFLVFRGQGVKLASFVAKKCLAKNTLMPDLEKPRDSGGYEGAIVLPPKCSFYMDNPVACVDYASLYPSGMISQNYSHDSKVWVKEFDLDGNLVNETGEKGRDGAFMFDNLPGYEYIDIEFDVLTPRKIGTAKEVKVKTGTRRCRWAQLPAGQRSILPAILEELLQARAKTRKIAKTEPDPFMRNILDKRQLGYKVTANSLYGQCGSRTSSFYEKDVAASTTATGRAMIMYARRVIEEVYADCVCETQCAGTVRTRAEYIYGDTDSVFFTFNLCEPDGAVLIRGPRALAATIELAQEAAGLCSRFLKAPMELSYEKTLMPFILLSKKRYVGMLYEMAPKGGVLKYMGLSLKRRDSCDYLKDVYGRILEILMIECDIAAAIAFLDASMAALIDGRVPMDKLAITKALRSDYKNPKQIAHAVLAERIGARDAGNRPRPGDRMKFAHIVNADRRALQGDCIETPQFIVENRLKIDYAYYITNQLANPLMQLFGLALEQIWDHTGDERARRTYRAEIAGIEREFGADLEVLAKKKETYCAGRAKVALLDKHLNTLYASQRGIRSVADFFKPV
jgi:DNA polymerase elongation subunit (family B)